MNLRSLFLASCCVLIALLTSQQAFAAGSWVAHDDISYTPPIVSGNSDTWQPPPAQASYCIIPMYDDWGYYCQLAEYDLYIPGVRASFEGVTQRYDEDWTFAYHAHVSWGATKQMTRANLYSYPASGYHYFVVRSVLQYCGPDPLFGGVGCYTVPQNDYTYPLTTGNVSNGPCFGPSTLDQQAVSDINDNFPLRQNLESFPFEEAVTIQCNSNNQAQNYGFNDSFGTYYPSGPVSHDPCASSLYRGPAMAGGVHTHPYFRNLTELNADLGCRRQQGNDAAITPTNTANNNFSDTDRAAMLITSPDDPVPSLGKSFYLRVAKGGTIIRTETNNMNGPNTQVFP